MFRRSFSFFIFLLLPVFAMGQEEDFRTWWDLELEGELFNLVDFSVAPEIRLWDNSTRLESFLATADLSVPVTKFLRFGLEYRHEINYKREDMTRNLNRFGIYTELDCRIERLRMAYRAMYHSEYTNISRDEEGKIPESVHRHKISFKYRRKGWDIAPMASAEMFYTIRPRWNNYQQKLRITAGLQYRLTKDININLQYKYQQEYYENNPLTSHIISTGIEYEL
jgi:hypothetical protein